MNINLDIRLLKAQAHNLISEEKFTSAILKIQRILKQSTHKKARLYSWLGNIHADNQDFIKAHQKYKKAFIINDPDYPEVAYFWANLLYHENKFEEARLVLEKYVQAHDSHADAVHLLANICFRLDLHIEADKAYQRAANLNPMNPEIYENWASSCYFLEDFDRAKKYLRRALGIDPNVAEVFRKLGCMYLTEQKYQEASDCFKKSLEINSLEALAWFNWSLVLMLRNEDEEAMVKFNKGVGLLDNGDCGNRKEDILEVLKNDLKFQERYVESGKDEQRKIAFKASLEKLRKIILFIEQHKSHEENISLEISQK